MLKTYTFQKDAPAKVTKLVFLLHGLGSNGQDLLGMAPAFAKALPTGVLFVSPDAPDVCDMAPAGYEGSYQWFSLQNRDPQIIAKEVEKAAPHLQDYIKKMAQDYGLSLEDVALVGFSQGTMLSLQAGLRLSAPLAGILAYSGAMARAPEADALKIPVTLIHGDADDVVPASASQSAAQLLESLGYESTLHLRPGLAHGIDAEGQRIGIEFLNRILT